VIGLLKNERGIALAVLTMLIAILASMTGAALLFSRIDLMISSNFRKGTGALYAADAGVAKALDQITAAQGNFAKARKQFGPIEIDGYEYRTGTRSDGVPTDLPPPQPMVLQWALPWAAACKEVSSTIIIQLISPGPKYWAPPHVRSRRWVNTDLARTIEVTHEEI